MRLVLCTPGYSWGREFRTGYSDIIYNCGKHGIDVIEQSLYSSIGAFASRNACLGGNRLLGKDQLPFGGKLEYDYILWIDADITHFGYKYLVQMIDKDVDIISGIYKMNDGKRFAVSEICDDNYLYKHGNYEFLTTETMPKETFKAAGIGFGFVLIKHGVFESLQYPWFYHKPIQNDSTCFMDLLGEDYTICEEFNAKGFDIYVDPSIRLGHKKEVIII